MTNKEKTMFFKTKFLATTATIFSMLVFSASANAGLPSFNNITSAQAETIVEEFGASGAHTSVSGAASLGSIFGIEAGAIIGLMNSNGIKSIVDTVNPGTDIDVSSIPHAALLVAVSLPLGLGAEVTFLPSLDLGDVKIERTGLAGKLTLTDTMLDIPLVDIAIKAHFTTAKLSYTQPIAGSSVSSNISFDSKILGADLFVGYDLNLVLVAAEIYASAGFVQVDGDFSSSIDIFDSTVTGLTASSKKSGADFKVGATFKLLLFKLGLEYQNILGNTRTTAKFSLKF